MLESKVFIEQHACNTNAGQHIYVVFHSGNQETGHKLGIDTAQAVNILIRQYRENHERQNANNEQGQPTRFILHFLPHQRTGEKGAEQ